MIYNIAVLSVAFLLSAIATRKLLRSTRLLKRTKRLNIILVWLIPLVWALIVLLYSDEPPKKNKKYKSPGYLNSGYQQYFNHRSN